MAIALKQNSRIVRGDDPARQVLRVEGMIAGQVNCKVSQNLNPKRESCTLLREYGACAGYYSILPGLSVIGRAMEEVSPWPS